MQKMRCILLVTVLLVLGAAGFVSAAAGNAVERHAWQGDINGKIPVSVWIEIRDGLVVGELVYTKTKGKVPIRLLGEADKAEVQMREMLPDGLVSGYISGSIKGEVFEGTWSAPGKNIEKSTGFEYVEGKSYPIRLSRSGAVPPPFRWEHAPESLEGAYRYSYGENSAYGIIRVAKARGSSLEYSIEATGAAPSFNMANLPEGLEGNYVKGSLKGNRVVHEIEGDCAYELLFYNGFVVSRYLEGRFCVGWFGRGAEVSGTFLKTGK